MYNVCCVISPWTVKSLAILKKTTGNFSHKYIYILKHAYIFLFAFRIEKALRQFFICPLKYFPYFSLNFSSTLNSSGWHYSHSSVRALSEGYEIYHGLFFFQPTEPQGGYITCGGPFTAGVPNIFAQLNPHTLLGLPPEIVSNVNGSINIMHVSALHDHFIVFVLI